MSYVREQEKNVFKALKERFGWSNVFQAPRLEKVVVSSGTGSIIDQNKVELIQDRLARITGQQPRSTQARKSIASFKIRQGDRVGYQVTLRGVRARAFLDKLINIALPRTKDFRGLSKDSVDEMGNMTLGVREHTVFPETSDEELKDVFGLAVTLTTTAKDKETALAFFEQLGIPFKKEDEASE